MVQDLVLGGIYFRKKEVLANSTPNSKVLENQNEAFAGKRLPLNFPFRALSKTTDAK